jgi:hypothetical protein
MIIYISFLNNFLKTDAPDYNTGIDTTNYYTPDNCYKWSFIIYRHVVKYL